MGLRELRSNKETLYVRIITMRRSERDVGYCFNTNSANALPCATFRPAVGGIGTWLVDRVAAEAGVSVEVWRGALTSARLATEFELNRGFS
jgi:hypothetical protein